MKTDAKYLAGLDVLRCLLALSILLFHYYHFSTPFMGKGYADKQSLPFSNVFMLLYEYGGFAVEIFWMISGMIFYHFYQQTISEGKMKLQQFIFLRFSRLYPVHFVTLLSVAFLQTLYQSRFHETFIYDNNDLLHFILNLFMVNFWNPKFGLSFNGPFWSVSTEIFIYIVFYIFSKTGMLNNLRNLFLLALIFFIFYSLGILSPFYECFLYFFTGCLLICLLGRIRYFHIGVILSGTILLLLLKYKTPVLPGNAYIIRSFDCFIKIQLAVIIALFFSKGFASVTGTVKSILREMGNMTYAVYMIHISVEMILVILFFEKGRLFFNSPVFFFSYITGLSVMGILCYRLFEMPVQNYLRQNWERLMIKDKTRHADE